jgi:hypothetical protein
MNTKDISSTPLFDTYHNDRSTFQFADEPIVIQSDYFNVNFLKSLEELNGKINVSQLLVESAHEVAYSQLSVFFKKNEKLSDTDKKKFIEDYYAHCGFGKISLKAISNKGGYAILESEHYAEAWLKYFGERKSSEHGVGYFTVGFLSGAVEALFGTTLGTFAGKQSLCISKGDEVSRFDIFRGLKKKLHNSPGLGKEQGEIKPIDNIDGIDDQKIVDLIKTLNFSGIKDSKGFIENFESNWTRHYANYYSMIVIKLLMQAEKKLGKGGVEVIKKMLTDVGESNAYFVFGKIVNSEYWQENIIPSLGSDNNQQMHGCLDIMTAFGFGKWELVEHTDHNFTFNITNNPNTNAFLKLVGNTKAPLGYYTGGFLIGLVNFIAHNPKSKAIDNDFVENLKSSKNNMSYQEIKSRMVGADRDTIVVNS